MLRRQCTNEYKIEQVDKAIREYLNVPRIIGRTVEVWKGISLDEIDRMSIPQVNWKVHVYPFCGYQATKGSTDKILMDHKIMTRNDLVNWYNNHNLPIPPKSSCVFCPYQSDAAWRDMKINEPSDFKAAVKVDKRIRDSTKKGIKSKTFLHDSLKPLDQIEFKIEQPNLWHGECSGGCHT